MNTVPLSLVKESIFYVRTQMFKFQVCRMQIISGLYHKHTMITNYASSIVNKLEALLTDAARVIIYDCHVFIVQATGIKGVF